MDARNHGETEHRPEMTYDLMSQDTVKFIKDQGLEKVALIGEEEEEGVGEENCHETFVKLPSYHIYKMIFYS